MKQKEKKFFYLWIIAVIILVGMIYLVSSYNEGKTFSIKSVNFQGEIKGELPLKKELVVKTSQNAICYFKNSPEFEFKEFFSTGEKTHKQNFLFPYEGNRTIEIKCDNSELELFKNATFTIKKI